MQDKRLVRFDSNQLRLKAGTPFPVRIFANDRVPIEPSAVDELLSVLDCQTTLDHLNACAAPLARREWGIESVAITPDFHKGAGIPIGTVLSTQSVIFPQAVGNDINCGMRLHTTDLDAHEVANNLEKWETGARSLFFEGGRQIPMTGLDREALLTEGLTGIVARAPWQRLAGQWQTLVRHGWDRQLDRVERSGSLAAATASVFADWIGEANSASYDDQIGSIGGGNHFVEIQRVERILDRQTAFAWGLEKGAVTIMIHSGSVGIGHTAGRFIRELLRSAYPASTAHPTNGIYPLWGDGPFASQFWNLLNNAANFAFANRLFLAASAVDSLERILGEFNAPLLYDSPHNLVWKSPDGTFLHRKGATPARGIESMEGRLSTTGENLSSSPDPWGLPVSCSRDSATERLSTAQAMVPVEPCHAVQRAGPARLNSIVFLAHSELLRLSTCAAPMSAGELISSHARSKSYEPKGHMHTKESAPSSIRWRMPRSPNL